MNQHQDSAKALPTDLESTVVVGFGPMRQEMQTFSTSRLIVGGVYFR
jgi:hypothetical protein